MKEKHMEHILLYGEGNKFRLTGSYETSDINTFNYGEGNRGSSVRIPTYTMNLGCGYYEDRRPSSNIDPYIVSAIIVDTTCLNSKYCEQLVKAYKKYTKELAEAD
jgi:glutamine synthetase